MFAAVVAWLDRVGPLVFWTCAITLVALDTTAVAAVIGTKSRELVNRWTGTVLGLNVTLIGIGVGVPGVMYVAKLAVEAVAPGAPTVSLSTTKDASQRER
jgi:hypothetical protein